MKKFFLLFALLGCITYPLLANQPYNPPTNDNEIIDKPDDGTIKVTILSVSSTSMELLVEASDALDDFCN